MKQSSLWVVLVALALAGCRPATLQESRPPERQTDVVRVGLAVGVKEAVLVPRGDWRGKSSEGTWDLPDGTALAVAIEGDRVVGRGGSGGAHTGEIQLEPGGGDAAILYVGVPYRGSFTIRAEGGGLTIVETVPIETYLRGVVPWEIGWLGSELSAAMEAQAIAARTYTFARLGQYETFDVFADERDQVYKGEQRPSAVADRALQATRGQVLRYGGQLIQAYYSSTCGGHTSWVERVWPKPAAPYLRGHRDADGDGQSYCAGSPHFRWTEAWSGAAMERTLAETVPRVLQWPRDRKLEGGLVDLRVASRDESGRVLDLDIVMRRETVRVHGDSIRWVLRPDGRALLRSLMFELDVEKQGNAVTRVTARGGGNGHGVGMCQTGAQAMAKRGADAAAILAHYYPGAELERAY
jgi:stage II sporulation protein D